MPIGSLRVTSSSGWRIVCAICCSATQGGHQPGVLKCRIPPCSLRPGLSQDGNGPPLSSRQADPTTLRRFQRRVVGAPSERCHEENHTANRARSLKWTRKNDFSDARTREPASFLGRRPFPGLCPGCAVDIFSGCAAPLAGLYQRNGSPRLLMQRSVQNAPSVPTSSFSLPFPANRSL